jgi:hypothetical protein
MSCGCSGAGGNGAKFSYEVKMPDGTIEVVDSKPEARILIAAKGGGTYRAVPKAS